MIKSVVVDISEIKDEEKNPMLCLSPLRFTGQCWQCVKVKQHVARLKKTGKYTGIIDAMRSMKCKPIIDKETALMLTKKEQLEKRIEELKKEIIKIERKMEE